MSVILTAAPGTFRACVACASTDVATLEDGRTACCDEEVIAYTCETCDEFVYFAPDGTAPECPRCHPNG